MLKILIHHKCSRSHSSFGVILINIIITSVLLLNVLETTVIVGTFTFQVKGNPVPKVIKKKCYEEKKIILLITDFF